MNSAEYGDPKQYRTTPTADVIMALLLLAGVAQAWSPFQTHEQQRVFPGAAFRKQADAIAREAAALMESGGVRPPSAGVSWFDIFMVPENSTRLERKDWGKDLGAAFENFRIPAALVAGSALTGAFALSPLESDSSLHGVLKRLYLLFSVASFSSSIVTVALATSALVQLNQQHSGRDSAAANFDDFMSRAGYQIELWVAVNAHFTFGVASLVIAVALRCWVAYADEAFAKIATLIVASGLGLATSLGLPQGSRDMLVSLPLRYARMVLLKAFDVRHPGPTLLASVAASILAVVLTVQELRRFLTTGGAAL